MEKNKRLAKYMSHYPMLCRVCGDVARGINFNLMTCMSCKTFFRRNAYRQMVSLLLFKNKEACLKLVNRTADAFNSAMQARVTVYATNESLHDEQFDFVKMQKIVQTYFPAEAALVTRK